MHTAAAHAVQLRPRLDAHPARNSLKVLHASPPTYPNSQDPFLSLCPYLKTLARVGRLPTNMAIREMPATDFPRARVFALVFELSAKLRVPSSLRGGHEGRQHDRGMRNRNLVRGDLFSPKQSSRRH